jgi:hypothetical protein
VTSRHAPFYRDKVGFKLDQLDDEEAYLTIGGGIVLAIKSIDLVANEISQERIRPREEEGIKRAHYVVFVNDLDDAYKELTQKGVHFYNAVRRLANCAF